MSILYFTVDAALLKELGERLVGKPHIALAELVKNGYDADANTVIIELDPDNDRIEIRDDGHGMDFDEFENFWMRIGSTHKGKQQFSRGFGRPMTGSKGVGRLSVQFLAEKLELHTSSAKNPNQILEARVEWRNAIQAGDLTKAEVEYEVTEIEGDQQSGSKGTTIILSGLKHDWKDKDSIRELAKELWWLQPPFRDSLPIKPEDGRKNFKIEFVSPKEELAEKFKAQIQVIMDIWHARLIGKNTNGIVNLSLEFAGKEPTNHEYVIPDCELEGGDFEIRIYHLKYRQPYGIKVRDAREYFNDYGGVHVYDGGFHLPYYGMKQNDWLHIQHDQAQRTRVSRFLPKDLQFDGANLSFLPTLSRVFGVVNVDTSQEPSLNILITRDRLEDNAAFNNLICMIRWAVDLYAIEELRRNLDIKKSMREIEAPREKFKKVEDVLVRHRSEISEPIYEDILAGVREATDAVESQAEAIVKRMSLVGPLATAGLSSLAYQHELNKQFHIIDNIVKRLGKVTVSDGETLEVINRLKEDLRSWVKRARATNALFAYFSESENIEQRERFRAKKVVEEIKEQVDVLARGIPIETNRIDEGLLLPKATLAEWGSIFQNVFINAFNAMLDSEERILDVSSRFVDGYCEILVQDTGSGVDLAEADDLFEPFVRRSEISPERRSLGYGGTGLGLTVVNLISWNIGCSISFVEPEQEFKTAFSIKWREKE